VVGSLCRVLSRLFLVALLVGGCFGSIPFLGTLALLPLLVRRGVDAPNGVLAVFDMSAFQLFRANDSAGRDLSAGTGNTGLDAALALLASHSATVVVPRRVSCKDIVNPLADHYRTAYEAPGLCVSVVSRCFAGDTEMRYVELGVSGSPSRVHAFGDYIAEYAVPFEG